MENQKLMAVLDYLAAQSYLSLHETLSQNNSNKNKNEKNKTKQNSQTPSNYVIISRILKLMKIYLNIQADNSL